MDKREQDQIVADAAWWYRLANAFGWTLQGFSWRHHATFLTLKNAELGIYDTIQINGHQANQMMASLVLAQEGLIDGLR